MEIRRFYQRCRFCFILIVSASLIVIILPFHLFNAKPVVHTVKLSEDSTSILTVRSNQIVTSQLFQQISTMKEHTTTTTITTTLTPSPLFQNNLPTPNEVRQWSSDRLDSSLHHLSHWNKLDNQGWRAFVNKTIAELNPPLEQYLGFTYFELGVGVGAFSRRLLLDIPHARGVGVDLAKAAVDIAQAVLPEDRMKLHVVSSDQFTMFGNNTFDYIIGSGVICYLSSLASVENILRELIRITKPNRSMCFTTIPYEDAGKIPCNLAIPPSFWSQINIKYLGIRVTSIKNMSEWNLPYTESRYAIYLRKENDD